MGNNRILRAAVIATLLAAPLAAQAQVTNEELLKRIEEQDQKIKVLERKLEIRTRSRGRREGIDAGRRRGPERLQPAVGRRQEPDSPARHAAPRLPQHLGDGPGRHGRHLRGDPRAADDRGHVRQHLRLQVHAGLRPGPHGHPGRLRQRPLQAGRRRSQLGKFKAPIGLERLQSANDMRCVAARLSRRAS